MKGDTVTIWPGENGEKWIDELDKSVEQGRFENRNQAILDAIMFYLLIDDVLGDHELWETTHDVERRSMLMQALIDYRENYLED